MHGYTDVILFRSFPLNPIKGSLHMNNFFSIYRYTCNIGYGCSYVAIFNVYIFHSTSRFFHSTSRFFHSTSTFFHSTSTFFSFNFKKYFYSTSKFIFNFKVFLFNFKHNKKQLYWQILYSTARTHVQVQAR